MPNPIRVLVVDDSATARTVIRQHLNADPDIEVIGTAADGLEALNQVKLLHPDVVTLDIMMPRMDGLIALRRIMSEAPTPVIMVSVLSREGGQITIKALELGAVDFVLKRLASGATPLGGMMEDLIEKVKAAATANITQQQPPAPRPPRPAPAEPDAGWRDRVVIIGSSTGGPQALRTLLLGLPADMPVPLLIVQHMPAWFTGSLAESLNSITPFRVLEARAGMEMQPGTVLVAPGDYHTLFNQSGTIRLSKAAREGGLRPSINIALQSAAEVFGANTLGVILTGMGSDGTRGARLVKSAGGDIIAQDKASSVIYGMPRAVADSGLADKVLPLQSIAAEIVRLCRAAPVGAGRT